MLVRYTREELQERFAITEPQFWRWRKRGLIPPAVIPPGAPKTDAYYTDEHFQRIQAIIAVVIDGRVTINDLRERFHYEQFPEDLDDGDTFE